MLKNIFSFGSYTAYVPLSNAVRTLLQLGQFLLPQLLRLHSPKCLFRNAVTCCFPVATTPDILEKLARPFFIYLFS